MDYINLYEFKGDFNADGSLTKKQQIKFMSDVQNKMMDMPLENFGKQILPYCGVGESEVGIAEGWKMISALSDGDEYCFIEFGNGPSAA